MKIPETFKPEKKDLEEHVEALRSDNRKKIKDLKDLILKNINFDNFILSFDMYEPFEEQFSYFTPINQRTNQRIHVQYEESIIHIIKFNTKITRYGLENIIDGLNKYNEEHKFDQVEAVFKDEYVIFIYSLPRDCCRRRKFINLYKDKFNFEEVRED